MEWRTTEPGGGRSYNLGGAGSVTKQGLAATTHMEAKTVSLAFEE